MSNNFDGILKVSSWGATKFIETSNAAVGATRLSQVVDFQQLVISVGWVSTYLLVARADLTVDFTLNMEVRNCDENGNPTNLLGSSSVLSSALSGNGWYKFDVNVSEIDNPENGLCFVYWQTGGDENNYASWGHNLGSYTGALISHNGGSTWQEEEGLHRVMRVAANFDAFSEIVSNKRVVTPSGRESVDVSFTGGTYENTRLISTPSPYYGYQQLGSQKIVLDRKDLHVAMVIDSSGSMGWRDRFGARKAISEELISRFKADYPGVVTFDFVNFGGRPIDIVPVTPSQKVAGVLVKIDDISAISGVDSSGNPLLAADVRSHMASGIVSYGYKNLKSGTTYVNYGFSLGWDEFRFDSTDSKWTDMWSSDSPTIDLGSGGPNGESAIDIALSDSSKDSIRYVFGTGDNTPRDFIGSDISSGDTVVQFDNSASEFGINSIVNVVDKNGISAVKQVTDSTDTDVTVNSQFYIDHLITTGAVIESNLVKSHKLEWGQTDGIEFFFLDSSQLGDVTFYVQTANGAHLEWNFTPLSNWELINFYFLDETAIFDIETIDANGNPLPDGTTVEFYVDKNPEADLQIDIKNEQESILLTQDAAADQAIIYVSLDNVSKFSRGDEIDLVDDDRNPQNLADGGAKEYLTSTIVSTVEDSGKITLSDNLSSAFLVDEGAAVLLPATVESKFEANLQVELPIEAGLVDVTPIYSGVKVPNDLRDQIDPPQTEPGADYDAYNSDPSRVHAKSVELTTLNGYAAIRLLPITEDRFLTENTKNAFAKSMFDLSEREQIRAQALDDMEKGVMKEGVDDATVASVTTESSSDQEPIYYDGVPDFIIDHRVTPANGLASTNMTSFTKDLTSTMIGSATPREYMAKLYSIYPVMTLYDGAGDKLAIVLMDQFDAYFASPFFIKSSVDSTVTYYDCPPTDPDSDPYDIIVPGTYATDEDDVTVTYEVTNKNFPATGVLSISIYDARRTQDTANVQDEDLSDPNGCGDFSASDGTDNVFSTTDIDDSYTDSISNSLLASDLLGSAALSQFEITITAGKASFVLPQIDRVALLEIHAEFKYSNGYSSVVNKQKVYYKSPLVLRLTGVGSATADGETKVNVGASVWWKEEAPVADGTIVLFESDKSNITPSMSETINGSADGVLVGPHEPILPPATVEDLISESNGDYESIKATVSYQGFTTEKSDDIIWGGQSVPAANFYFYAKGENVNPDSVHSGTQKLWADGRDYVVVNGDLPASSLRAFPSIEQVYQDLVGDRMGVVYTGVGLTTGTRLPRWSDEAPLEGPYDTDVDVPYGWVSNKIFLNRFIGRPEPRTPTSVPNPCLSPECQYVTMYTRSRKHNVVGTGIENETPTFPATTPSGAPADIPKPRVYPIEPLGITMSIEPIDRSEYQSATWREAPLGKSPSSSEYDTYNYPLVRNGENRYLIIAEITWRDETLVNLASNPLPEVRFEAGLFSISEGLVTLQPFSDPNEAPLDSPTATVDYLRTTCDSDHYHEVTVDANGFGRTTNTISSVKDIVIDDHEHTISLSSTPVILEGIVGTVVHGHNLKSVAIVGMGPVRNRTLPIAIRGEVTYDNGKIQSDGTRVGRTLDNYVFSSPADDSENESLGYKLEIITVDKQYVSGRVTDGFPTRLSGSDDGYTILYKATVVKPGEIEVPVEDGTRIFTDFKFYEFNDDDTGTEEESDVIIISRDEEVRNHAVLKVDAFFSKFPDEAKADKEIAVTSSKRWFPSVEASPFIRKPETDAQAIQSSIDSFTELGSSQINDALSLAARRIVKFSDTIGDSKKIIVVISDMTEGHSDYSYDQALADVAAADVSDPVEVFPIKVANVDQFSDLIAQKFAFHSGGEVIAINDVENITQSASDAVGAIVESPKFDATSGTYTNIVDLGNSKVFNSLKFNTVVPPGARVTFRVQFSADGITYGDWLILGTGTEFNVQASEAFGRFMRYEVAFSANPINFETPEFTGMECEYFEPSGYTMFFKPIQVREGADGYVGEIIFTHQGTIPPTSSVRYGIAHCDSSDLVDYGWKSQPLMTNDFGGIILSRVNELLNRNDSLNYTAPYGGWNGSYDVEVYRISDGHPNGILMDPAFYSIDAINGKIVFIQPQPSSDKFTITLGLNSEFRIVVDMLNRGQETISLDYIGAMYRTVDRADIYEVTRKSVTSVVNTDLGTIEETGTVVVSGVSFVTEMGIDSDIIKDVVFNEDNYYALVYESSTEKSYIAVLQSNFTFVSKTYIENIGEPVSIDLMDSLWYVSSVSGNKISIASLDSSFRFVSTSDFGFIDEHPAVIRSIVDRWHTPNGSTIDIFSRSLSKIQSVALEYEITSLLDTDSSSYTAVSEKRDILFVFSLDGEVVKAYSLVTRPTSASSIRRYDNTLLIVEPFKIVQGKIY